MSLPTPDVRQVKTFWERPEGRTGTIVAVALLSAVGIGLYHLLPFLITLFQNTLIAVGLGVALVAALYVISQKRYWVLADYFFKSAMRKITQVFVEIDPIGIMRNYVSDLKHQQERMDEQISKLRGQIRVLKEQIARNEKERTDALRMAKQAKEQEKRGVFAVQARQAGRKERSNLTFNEMLQRMELIYRVLAKYRESSDIIIADIENEVENRNTERQMIMAAHRAMESAKAIMKGQPDKLELFNQAMAFTAEDYGKKLGEIEQFVDMSSNIIGTLDLQNGVYEQEALELIAKWEEKTESILLGDEKRVLVADAKNPAKLLDLDTTPTQQTQGKAEKYSGLLGDQ